MPNTQPPASDYDTSRDSIIRDISDIRKSPTNEAEMKLYNMATDGLKHTIDSLVAEEVRKAIEQNNRDIRNGFDFKCDDDIYSVGELKKVKPKYAALVTPKQEKE